MYINIIFVNFMKLAETLYVSETKLYIKYSIFLFTAAEVVRPEQGFQTGQDLGVSLCGWSINRLGLQSG